MTYVICLATDSEFGVEHLLGKLDLVPICFGNCAEYAKVINYIHSLDPPPPERWENNFFIKGVLLCRTLVVVGGGCMGGKCFFLVLGGIV